MIRRIIRWLAKEEISTEYDRGWEDGVNQQFYEPDTAKHGLVDRLKYWGDDR